MKIRLSSELQNDSIVDGPGLRTIIWTQGCKHNCVGCHNNGTHDFCDGTEYSTSEIIDQIKGLKLQSGITFSGGDPMEQAKACTEIAKHIKENTHMNTWCYSGYTFEQILEDEDKREFLNYIDVLVDGKFEMKNHSFGLLFRGSNNQNIIDVKKSLKCGVKILVEKYNGNNELDKLERIYAI